MMMQDAVFMGVALSNFMVCLVRILQPGANLEMILFVHQNQAIFCLLRQRTLTSGGGEEGIGVRT